MLKAWKVATFILFLACGIAFIRAVSAQTTGTALTIGATWDDGSPVAGKVVLAQVKVLSAPSWVYMLDATGNAKATRVLESNAMYYARILTRNATTGNFTEYLYQFPFTTAGIDPANIASAGITFVFRKADRSVAGATYSVSTKF